MSWEGPATEEEQREHQTQKRSRSPSQDFRWFIAAELQMPRFRSEVSLLRYPDGFWQQGLVFLRSFPDRFTSHLREFHQIP